MSTATLAVDAMGGDFGPRFVVPACIASLHRYPHLQIILVGDSAAIDASFSNIPDNLRSRLHIQATQDSIDMQDAPAQMLRSKPDASMPVALRLVQQGRAQGCVSAGNTGALMALSKHILKPLPQIERPAIMAALPVQGAAAYLLDLGANLDCSAKQLAQFAIMGSAAVQLYGVAKPRVALLNVGVEALKGNQQVRAAAKLLESLSDIHYVGFIEADGVYRGEADVVVCDGFVGNVLLKSSEGVARMLNNSLREMLGLTLWRRMLARLNAGLWRQVRERWSPDLYNGALLLGVEGVVVKSHGGANQAALEAAIGRALQAVEQELPLRLGHKISQEYPLIGELQE